MSVATKWINGELRARRTDGKPLTDADREDVRQQAKQPGVSVDDVLGVFPGAKIVAEDKPLFCKHCDKDYIPEWRRGGRIVEARWPDGRVTLQCHYCGRDVKK
jgi:hypothetical protein